MSGNIGPHRDIQEITDFTGDVVLADATNPDGARNIFVVDDGNGGVGGAISVVTSVGQTRVITAVKSGEYLNPSPTYFTRINEAGTTVVKVIVGW